MILKRKIESNKIVIFHHQQIYYCMGMVIRYGNHEYYKGEIEDTLLNEIGIILLGINDLLVSQDISSKKKYHEI